MVHFDSKITPGDLSPERENHRYILAMESFGLVISVQSSEQHHVVKIHKIGQIKGGIGLPLTSFHPESRHFMRAY
jgi:hypothetical protein